MRRLGYDAGRAWSRGRASCGRRRDGLMADHRDAYTDGHGIFRPAERRIERGSRIARRAARDASTRA